MAGGEGAIVAGGKGRSWCQGDEGAVVETGARGEGAVVVEAASGRTEAALCPPWPPAGISGPAGRRGSISASSSERLASIDWTFMFRDFLDRFISITFNCSFVASGW